jgi:uncharacterized protein (DUF697 family)
VLNSILLKIAKDSLMDLINKITLSDMKNRELANEIVKNHVLYAVGAGAVPIPLVDMAFVAGVQLGMIQKLCNLYDVPFTIAQSNSLIAAIAGGTIARMGASFIKGIPGVGFLLGGISMPILSGASTYAVGQVFITHFESKGTLDNIDIETMKKAYEEQIEYGKEFAAKYQKKETGTNNITPIKEDLDSIIKKIEKLNELKEKGLLTEEEFQQKKQSLLASI